MLELLILFLIIVGTYGGFNYVVFGSHELGPLYLLIRVPFQFFLIGWAYYFGLRPVSASKAGAPAPIGVEPVRS